MSYIGRGETGIAMYKSWKRAGFRAGCALSALAALSACGGGTGGGVNSTPTPPPPVTPPPAPPPPPPPPPSGSFNTAEYQRSNGAAQAQAITGYNAGATGAGVIATVIDSGVAQFNAEFAGRIHAASTDLAGSRGIGDEGGHGTAVSDVLLGAKNDTGIHGVAFAATLLVARTDTPGSCATSGPDKGCMHDDNAIARGVDLAVTNGARVINISLGGSPPNSTLRAALGRATAAGIVIVFSAGNDSSNDPDPLAQFANDPQARNLILIAGSLDSSNAALADFSNRAGNAAAHYIGALGVSVRAIDHTGTSFLWSGTSFSAPIVSGAVALLAQAFPGLTGAQIVDLLLRTADDLGTPGIDSIFGNGALDLAKAFGPQGPLVFAGSQVPLPATTGLASAPMGDGGQHGLSAVVLDSYRRAYSADLAAGIAHAPLQPRLAPALGIGSRSLTMEGGSTAIALSVTNDTGQLSVDRLLLSAGEDRRARALAGSVVTRLGRNTAIALGISRSGLALASDLDRHGGGDFLVGSSALDSFGFDTRAKSGMAVRQQLGGIGLTVSAETGVARLWENGLFSELRRGYREHGYGALSLGASRSFGPFSLSARATNLIERDTILGARFDRSFGAGGARTWFADLEARWTPSADWVLTGAWRQGWTRLGAGGIRQNTDHLQTSAWSVDVVRSALFGRADRLSLRVAQPLRVSRGGFDLTLPTSYDYATEQAGFSTTRLNLAPTGRERDIEAAYSRALWGGRLSANTYWRRQPGNFANARDDLGAAIRFSFGL
jgi:hypothetical protein